MTFKDLQRVIESQPDHDNPEQSQLERLRGKAFWHWDRGEHKQKDRFSNGDCALTILLGYPKRNE